MMNFSYRIFLAFAFMAVCFSYTPAQTGNTKHFEKDGVSFDYPAGWTLEDGSNSDAQTLRLARADADLQLTVFVHRGRISAEKMPDAHKAFIDPYVEGTAKQLVSMGAKIDRAPDTTEISGIKAEGVKIKATVTGDSATSQIYWALIGQRVVILTFFGPDKDRLKFASSWDMVRSTLKVDEPKPKAPATPKKNPQQVH